MKLEGKTRDVPHPEGGVEPSRWPRTREEAFLEDNAKFWPLHSRCARHQCRPLWYTATNVQKCCRDQEAVDLHREMIRAGEPTDPGQAKTAGVNYYYTWKAGAYCGHLGKLTLAGKCWYCEQDRLNSPRQVARRDGQSWYQPADGSLCAKGHNAPRRVANGSCQQCENELHRAPPTGMEKIDVRLLVPPDTIITRAEAVAANFRTFRTGVPCRSGHTGWRYISTGACLACMGRP